MSGYLELSPDAKDDHDFCRALSYFPAPQHAAVLPFWSLNYSNDFLRFSCRSRLIAEFSFIFHFLWTHWAHCGIFENRVPLMYTLQGVSSVANFITAYEESQSNRDSHFLICSVTFVSKSITGTSKPRYAGFCLELPTSRWISGQGLRAPSTLDIATPIQLTAIQKQ